MDGRKDGDVGFGFPENLQPDALTVVGSGSGSGFLNSILCLLETTTLVEPLDITGSMLVVHFSTISTGVLFCLYQKKPW